MKRIIPGAIPAAIKTAIIAAIFALIFTGIIAPLLFTSCAGRPGRMVLSPIDLPAQDITPYIIIEHKNTAAMTEMPEWVIAYFDGGLAEIEKLMEYQGRHAFVAKNEGSNFTAMNHWMAGFSAELDFPRLAAARVEERFFSAAPLPDQEYGAYYEAMVRMASDFPWTGAGRESDFWIHKGYLPAQDEDERETFEFLILLTIDRADFNYQLQSILRNIKPNPPPTKDQLNAINRIRDRFFDSF